MDDTPGVRGPDHRLHPRHVADREERLMDEFWRSPDWDSDPHEPGSAKRFLIIMACAGLLGILLGELAAR